MGIQIWSGRIARHLLARDLARLTRARQCLTMRGNMAEDQLALLTVADVARVLRVRPARAYQLVRAGLVPGLVRVGRQVRVDEAALRTWVAAGGRALPAEGCATTVATNDITRKANRQP
jgi:excisionase family DNA binding protein